MHGLSVDIPPEAFGLLMIINYQEDIIQQDIAGLMKKDKSAVLRQIDSLEEKMLVRRVVDHHDRRKNIIVITGKGKELMKEILVREKELIDDLTKGIADSDVEIFRKVLFQLRTNAEKL